MFSNNFPIFLRVFNFFKCFQGFGSVRLANRMACQSGIVKTLKILENWQTQRKIQKLLENTRKIRKLNASARIFKKTMQKQYVFKFFKCFPIIFQFSLGFSKFSNVFNGLGVSVWQIVWPASRAL